MRDGSVQVNRLIGDQFAHRVQIGVEIANALGPRAIVRRCSGFWPISGGPLRRYMLCIAAELQNVPLREAHVLKDLPWRVLRAFGPLSPQRGRDSLDRRLERRVRLAA